MTPEHGTIWGRFGSALKRAVSNHCLDEAIRRLERAIEDAEVMRKPPPAPTVGRVSLDRRPSKDSTA